MGVCWAFFFFLAKSDTNYRMLSSVVLFNLWLFPINCRPVSSHSNLKSLKRESEDNALITRNTIKAPWIIYTVATAELTFTCAIYYYMLQLSLNDCQHVVNNYSPKWS